MSKFELKGSSMPALIVHLDQGESIVAESNAMVAMSTTLDLNAKTDGVLGMAMRKLTKNESMFQQGIEAKRGPGSVMLSSELPGDIKVVEVGSLQMCLNDGAFVACDASVSMHSRMQKLSAAFFGKTGGFLVMETSGQGNIAISALGEIIESPVPYDGLIVDNSHVVAWENSLQYSVSVSTKKGGLLGNIANSQMTGEGVVLKFTGQGRVWLSTRSFQSLFDYIKKESSK